MGRYHAMKLAARDDVELLGVVDPDSRFLPELPRLERVPADADFAVIATPTRLHVETALPLLRGGLPCLVEKPLAATPREAEQLAGFAGLGVNHIERFNPALEVLPSDVRPGYVRAERLAPFGGRGIDVDVVHDLMIHDLDLVLHLAGGEAREIRAVGVPVRTAGVDIAEVWMETTTGCVATLTASRISRAPSRRLRLVARDRYWSLDMAARSASQSRWGDGVLDAEPLEVGTADALEASIAGFIASVRGEAGVPVSGADGLAAVRLASRVSARIAERLGAAR